MTLKRPDSPILEKGAFFHRYAEGIYLFWNGIGAFYIEAATGTVSGYREPQCPEPVYLTTLNSLPASLSHWFSGAPVMHGTAVRYMGKNIALIGDSGFGKSTLSHYLIMSGAELLAEDDLRFDPKRKAFQASALPYQKLWKETWHALHSPFALSHRIVPGLDKFLVEVPLYRNGKWFSVDAAFILSIGEKPGIRPMSFAHAMMNLQAFSKGGRAVGPDFERENFRRLHTIIPYIPVLELQRPKGLEYLSETAQLIEQHLEI